MAAWYDFPIGRPHDPADNANGGELGVDLSTPLFTRITTPVAGTVSYAGSNASTGGIVKVVTGLPGAAGEYFLHLKSITVAPGQRINAGDTVGFSGGDQPGAGGWPHVEFGLFNNLAHAGEYWGFQTGDTLDPTGYINALHTSGGVAPSSALGATGWGSGSAAGGIPGITVNVQSSLGSLAQSLGKSQADLLTRGAIIAFGAVLLLIGFIVLIWPGAQRAGGEAANVATKATLAAA